MSALTIAWEYLTGYAAAADASNRDAVEWPPHPARVFMAMTAAHFESGECRDEAAALHWLEQQPCPQLLLPKVGPEQHRRVVTSFVPVNDRAGPAKMGLQCVPALTRSKQPRSFPKVYVGHAPCRLFWREARDAERHLDALKTLSAKVTRIGHSSSLVRMWVETVEVEADDDSAQVMQLAPAERLTGQPLRVVSEGTLDHLRHLYNEQGRTRHRELTGRIAELEQERKQIKGKGAQARKADVDEGLAALSASLEEVDPRPPLRPVISTWQTYAPPRAVSPSLRQGIFDQDLLVLRQVAGPRLGLESALQMTDALRGTVLAVLQEDVTAGRLESIPAWVSGHTQDGEPLRTGGGHLALLPLAHVSHNHADGSILGLALAFPRSVPLADRRVLHSLLFNEQGCCREIFLRLGPLGVVRLQQSSVLQENRKTLAPETWTSLPQGCLSWASVTPVVLDRFPKNNRAASRMAWEEEVAHIVTVACENTALPRPVRVRVSTTSLHLGSPRAISKARTLRGGKRGGTTALGSGFPAYPAKGANASRPQVHVGLEFAEPIVGPLSLGAGRFRGYGVCKPLTGGSR